ncbi:MAG: TlpA family protein disulfide reductase [Gammaproteobacteria bacterium]|nr:TlpA family protein disulfide reductase [Gammaproteobacteria bacterium]
MNNKMVVAVVIVIAALAGYLTYQYQLADDTVDEPTATEPAEVDNTARVVDFSLNDMDGNVRHLSDWNGQPRLVNFWATWCAPCRREIPLLKKLQGEQDDNGVQVIGIAVDFIEDVTDYAKEAEFNYPILVGQEDAMAAAESTGVEFIGLPFTLVITRDGQLLKTHIGEIVEEHVELIVEVLQRLDDDGLSITAARDALEDL